VTKSKIFFVLALTFLAGIFIVSFLKIEKYYILIIAVSGIAIFAINYKNKKVAIVSVAVLVFALGAWRANLSLDRAKNNLAGSKLGSFEFVARVIKEPETDEKYQKIIIRDNNNDKILINADIYPEYRYGDQLKVSCALQEPKNYEDSNFDYQMYLAKDGIYRICNRANILTLGNGRGNTFYAAVLSVKSKFEEKLSQIFPEPEGAYLKGLLLGGSKRMTKNISDAFSRTGTSHAIAVSGFNVTVVAAFLMWLGIFGGLWRQQAFWFAILGVIFFVTITGFPASAVRAGIMGGLVIWAMKEGRLANSTNAILFAAAAMLAINPLLLRYDVGFQLSFLATLGIVYLSPLFENFFWQGRAPKFVQETIFLTLAATTFVLPILVLAFEKISLVSPIANFLILPAIPFIMLGGFVSGIAGFIFFPLGKIMGFLPYLFLKAELLIIMWLGNLSWAAAEIKNYGWIYIFVYYSGLGLILYFAKRKSRSQPAVE
jgi:competence protein ComEC